jgi:RimJ/RimL family protein N-acetyltransferase
VSSPNLNIALRRASGVDATFLFQIRNQPTTVRFQASPQRTLAQVAEMLEEHAHDDLTRASIGRFYWTAVIEGEPVANIQVAVDQRDRGHQSATLGYTVAEKWHGRGVATRLARMILPIAFDPAGLAIERLEAAAAVGNLASCRVLEKAGFQFEGVQRGLLLIGGQRIDHACYAMLSTDAAARNGTR